jgi:hypothetical protein
MSDDEGVTPFEVARDATPGSVTPAAGKGALGTWRPQDGPRTQSRGEPDPRRRSVDTRGELAREPSEVGAYASRRLNLTAGGKARRGKPGSEPDSGKPTVRDRRGAWGNVTMVELGTHLAIERAGLVTLHLPCARSRSIPTAKK